MIAPVLELEGTWEEVAAHAPELAGRRVRLTVLPSLPKTENNGSFREVSGGSLLRHAGTWQGGDFEECLRAVIEWRGSVQFQDEQRTYLRHTNHCRRLILGDADLARCISQAGEKEGATYVSVSGELLDMAHRSECAETNLPQFRAFLEEIPVYLVDEATAEVYADLKSALFARFGPREKAKRRFTLDQLGIGENDLWIAAIALQHGLTVVSADADFARLQQVRPLALENWLML